MNLDKIRSIIEAIIFASEHPVTIDTLAQSIDGVGKEELATLVEQLVVEYRSLNRPFHLVEVGGGWQFRTKAEYGPWILRVTHDRPTKLSRASLETMAVIAYKQPITRPEIEDLRGVDSGAVVKNLLERNLIKIVGKKDAPGKPVVYGTAPRFLEVFSLRDLGSLPSLRDLKELDEGESGQLALPAVEGAEAIIAEAVEPHQISDSERRKNIRESIRGLLSVPMTPDGAPSELPAPPDDEDEAMLELEAALKRRKEAAERADAIFDESEKDYIEKVTTANAGDEPEPAEAQVAEPVADTHAATAESGETASETAAPEASHDVLADAESANSGDESDVAEEGPVADAAAEDDASPGDEEPNPV